MNKVIILLGQRVRSGTNFVGSTLSMHPEVITLPKHTSLGEFNLFVDATIESVFATVVKDSFGMEFDVKDKAVFLKNYGNAWLKSLIQKYNIPPDKTIFIKSPSVKHYSLWRAAFPKAKIAIIYRDGRDNVVSSVKASNDKRNWHRFILRLKKRINFYSGRSFINHSKEWAKTAKKVLEIEKTQRLTKFKYEELNNSETQIRNLLHYYELEITDSIVKKCLEAPVMGSSFGVQVDGMEKPNWKPDFDKSKFVFTNKWKKWGVLKKIIFKKIAGLELIKLGYEKDNNW